MKILIAGIDGYLGFSLARHLLSRGHVVGGLDAGLRRQWVAEMDSTSALPVAPMDARMAALGEAFPTWGGFWEGDLREGDWVDERVARFGPDAVVHFGECPSAPYSMIDRDHAIFVQTNNLTTTFNLQFAMARHCPEAQLVKVGTMGEYGTPNVAIPEGFFDIEYRGRSDRLPFPRQANSWYHWSKVHGSNNVMFACRTWGLRATDVMQGIVFGTRIDPGPVSAPVDLPTRLDFDQAFGTIVNRFCCQAVIGHPLTVYGSGGQQRSLLPLRDAMQCFTLALENPAAPGEYRVLNQFARVYSMLELAEAVRGAAAEVGLDAQIRHIENPRSELESHYYRPDHGGLAALGYHPSDDLAGELRHMLADLLPHRDTIAAHRQVLMPDIRWDRSDGNRSSGNRFEPE